VVDVVQGRALAQDAAQAPIGIAAGARRVAGEQVRSPVCCKRTSARNFDLRSQFCTIRFMAKMHGQCDLGPSGFKTRP
jgi:hypothetical protein